MVHKHKAVLIYEVTDIQLTTYSHEVGMQRSLSHRTISVPHGGRVVMVVVGSNGTVVVVDGTSVARVVVLPVTTGDDVVDDVMEVVVVSGFVTQLGQHRPSTLTVMDPPGHGAQSIMRQATLPACVHLHVVHRPSLHDSFTF